MDAVPFILHDKHNGQKLHRLDVNSPIYNEAWLQELLRKHPEALPATEIEYIYSLITPIGREVSTDTGAIDNLYISKQGYPVLVETKLWRNPEASREVLTQAIAYGSSLSKMTFADLDLITRTYTKKYDTEKKEYGLIDWMTEWLGYDVNAQELIDVVSKNLRLGRFLIMIVGDRIRDTLIDTLKFLKGYTHLAIDIALVEIGFYQAHENQDWPLFLIPTIAARTVIVERSILQVNVTARGVRIDEVPESDTATRKRVPLRSEDAFWDLFKVNASANLDHALQVINHFRSNALISIEPREASLSVHLILPDSGQRLSLFFLDKNGVITCWTGTISDQLIRAGYKGDIVNQYKNEMGRLLKKRTKKLAIYDHVYDIDPDQFNGIVDRFVESVLSLEI